MVNECHIIHVFQSIDFRGRTQPNMNKKYISKEDVDKGLVDPNKPLIEQKEYLQMIEKEEQARGNKKDKREGYKPRRTDDPPKYNWNRREITEDTPLPDPPKKVVPKPDKDKYHNQLNAYKKTLEQLYEQKTNLRQEKKHALQQHNATKMNGQAIKSKYSSVLKQKNHIKQILQEEVESLEEKKKAIQMNINSIKQKVRVFNKPDHFQECSKEELQKRLEATEQKLTTADLSKKEENRINQKVIEIKRAMLKSKPEIELMAEIGRLKDQENIYYHELKNLREDIRNKRAELKEVRGEISRIMEQKSQEQALPADHRPPEVIIADYDAKIDKVSEHREQVKKQIEAHKDQYSKCCDAYEDYDELVRYISMIKEEKELIQKRKEEKERRIKQKEQEEAKKKREFEQRERRREEKKKRDEERRREQEERRERTQKEREDYINRNPHEPKIKVCQYLIDYCEMLKPENAGRRAQQKEDKATQQIQELDPQVNKEWAKELKNGAQVVVSKKLKEETEAPKKPKKEKKKKDKPEFEQTTGFTHNLDLVNSFDQVNLLPPSTATEIDETIKQLNDRISFYSSPTEEEIAAYKQTAGKEFDEMHGLRSQAKRNYRQRQGDAASRSHSKSKPKSRDKYRGRKGERKAPLQEKDFPELG